MGGLWGSDSVAGAHCGLASVTRLAHLLPEGRVCRKEPPGTHKAVTPVTLSTSLSPSLPPHHSSPVASLATLTQEKRRRKKKRERQKKGEREREKTSGIDVWYVSRLTQATFPLRSTLSRGVIWGHV